MTEATGEQPAAERSALADLRARRQALVESNHKDFEVPGWDQVGPPVFVRFRPVEQAAVDRINAKHADSKAEDRTVVLNAAVFVEHCVGVYQLVDGQLVSIDPGQPAPKFDARLGDLLGLDPDAGAIAVVRALFAKDGDIISTAWLLNEWSGFTTARAQREFSGN